MTRCLKDLKVTIFDAEGNYEKALAHVLGELSKKITIAAIFENRDFSPFARERQKITSAVAKKRNLRYILCEDSTLFQMGQVLKSDGTAYVKFTPFYTAAKKYRIPHPENKPLKLLNFKSHIPPRIKQEDVGGGRAAALKILAKIDNWRHYSRDRDFPNIPTTRLSAHLHFGTVSVREVYHSMQIPELRRQLYWREFYMYITNYVNTDYSKKVVTRPQFNSIKWSNNREHFKKWCQGHTGYPIVDAAMRELNSTGYMHNRCRMIVAMFLIFYLHIHWKEGEKYFAQNLIDYSYSNNFGGWVWCAGLETYSNDYFRAFSMESQSQRFDPKAEYIKKWLPELKDELPKNIHKGANLIVPPSARIAGINMMRKK